MLFDKSALNLARTIDSFTMTMCQVLNIMHKLFALFWHLITFPLMKSTIEGHRFSTVFVFQIHVAKMLKNIPADELQKCFDQ